uniref:DUF6598 domain-containing protein n=1 Tax=Chenopodium quinoa TaxID=63459 RepID=A0A803NBU9_CHEQI
MPPHSSDTSPLAFNFDWSPTNVAPNAPVIGPHMSVLSQFTGGLSSHAPNSLSSVSSESIPLSESALPSIGIFASNALNTHVMTTRLKDGIRKACTLLNLKTEVIESLPKFYKKAAKDPRWCEAMAEEYNAMITNDTWEYRGHIVILLVYADDIILTSSNPDQAVRTSTGLLLSQEKYVLELILKFHLYTSKPVRTPVPSRVYLSLLDGELLAGPIEYLSMIFAGRPDLGIFLHSTSTPTIVIAYSNANWVGFPMIDGLEQVFLNPKTGCDDVCSKIWGSLIAQYSGYGYTSRFNKDYYRIVLFEKIKDDLIQLIYSFLDMDLDLKQYAEEYYNVSIEEIHKIRAENYSNAWFDATIISLHERRDWEISFGRRALRTQPLAHVLSFFLDETNFEFDYEQVKSMSIDCEQGSIIVNYICIPFGVHCRIEIKVCSRQGKQHDGLNVNGKIVARYANTYGNYSSEDCVLFEKQDSDFPVEINPAKRFPLSRCWVSLPSYSSLIVNLNLYEFKTMRKIVDQSVKLSVEDGRITSSSILLDDLAIHVHVAWFSPDVVGQRIDSKIGFPSSFELSWNLRAHQSKPWASPALEIFSIFFGRGRQKTVQIYGSIEVLSDDDDMICYIFNRDEKDALVLSENEKSLPVSDGSRVFDDCSSLQMKFSIKDIEDRLAIRGLVDWAVFVLDTSLWYEKQLCSLILGQHGGFAAIHYSIFSEEAVGANIKVFLNPETGCDDVCSKIWGSLIA